MLNIDIIGSRPPGNDMFGAIGGLIGGVAKNLFNRNEAKKNRQFQEYMSSTAYQRAVVDMRKAGINPILAASRGGAAMAGGAQAVGENVVNSAFAAEQQRTQTKLLAEQKDLVYEQAQKEKALTKQANASSTNIEYQNVMHKLDNAIYSSPWGPMVRIMQLAGPSSAAMIAAMKKLNIKVPIGKGMKVK